MNVEKPKLTKEQLKKRLDNLREEIKYRVSEAKKGDVTEGAHKQDVNELMKKYRSMKEAYDRICKTEEESMQLEDMLSSLAEEKEEDPKKQKEREELHKKNISTFDDLISLVNNIKQLLPKAKKETEKYYKDNPTSYSSVYNVSDLKEKLESIKKILESNQEPKDE
jgi:DNA repair ATPase RecN